MRRLIPLLLLAGGLNCLQANVIPLFSTGDGSTTDGHVDPNWTYTNASSVTGSALVAGNPGTDFFNGSCCGGGPWAPNTSSSAWIVDNISSTASGGDPLSFQTSFSLDGLDPISAVVSLEWGIDDGGNLLLNGAVVDSLPGQNGHNWDTLHSVTLNSGFVAGVNTLQIVFTSNDNSYEGVRVQIDSALATSVPEPRSGILLGFGAVLLLTGVRANSASHRRTLARA